MISIINLIQALLLGIQIWALINMIKNEESYKMNSSVGIFMSVPILLLNLIR